MAITYRDTHDVDLTQLAALFRIAGWARRAANTRRLEQLVRGRCTSSPGGNLLCGLEARSLGSSWYATPMRTRVTLRFLDEVLRYRLRYTCDECAYFVPTRSDDSACAHGYPTGERRARRVVEGDEVEFCKEFEA